MVCKRLRTSHSAPSFTLSFLKMKTISTDCQNAIVSLLRGGRSISQAAHQLGMSTSTVFKYKNARLPDHQMPKGGRVSKLTDRDKSNIRRKILTGQWRSAAEVHANLVRDGHELTNRTVCRTLKSMGFEAKKKIKKPFLTNRHKEARYEWAKEHEFRTVEDWRRVIFSDETKITIWGSDGCKYYWSLADQPIQDHHVIATVKHGGD